MVVTIVVIIFVILIIIIVIILTYLWLAGSLLAGKRLSPQSTQLGATRLCSYCRHWHHHHHCHHHRHHSYDHHSHRSHHPLLGRALVAIRLKLRRSRFISTVIHRRTHMLALSSSSSSQHDDCMNNDALNGTWYGFVRKSSTTEQWALLVAIAYKLMMVILVIRHNKMSSWLFVWVLCHYEHSYKHVKNEKKICWESWILG